MSLRFRLLLASLTAPALTAGDFTEGDFENPAGLPTGNPAAPWFTTETSGDPNPIYLWDHAGTPGNRALVLKDGNGSANPDHIRQPLDAATADRFSSFTLTLDAGWRGALASDTATLRVSIWSETDGRELGGAEITLTSATAISDTWTPADGDPTAAGIQPFTVTIPHDPSDPGLAGDRVSLRIRRVDPDSGLGSSAWRSSVWIDNLSLDAPFAAEPVGTAETGLLARVVPALADRIRFEPLAASSDTFQLGHDGDQVVISGNNPNARIAGLRWYLVHHCGMHFSWSGDQTAVPDPLPLPDEAPRSSPWKWRSAHNHCVFSYSMAFWDWERWQRELDFLALHGINQAFLLTGHEKIWQNTLRRLGFSDAQIETWLPSTSHIAWWHFDNLQGYGGPLTQHEIDQEAALARQVADRMRELGIEPVTMGFYGMVPDFFGSGFPDAHIIPQGSWVGGFARPPVLDPSDPAFATTAAVYYEEMEAVLGSVRFYGGDLFHEGGNTGGLDLGPAYRAIQDGMLAHRPDATWVMFGWTGNPRQEGLDACRPDRVLVQQTSKHLGTAAPVSGSFRDYGGWIPWTWQIIDNFGGNHGLYGNFDTIATLPSRFLDGGVPGNFAGLGHSPEGIETNPLQTALYYDMFWRDEDVDVAAWLDETLAARYGKPSSPARAAWDLLARSSYRCPVQQEGIADYIFATRPRPDATRARTWSSNTPYWCELDIVEAWKLLLDAAPELAGNANYRHDLVDVTRHALNFHSKHVFDEMMAAFEARDLEAFDTRSAELLALFDDLDAVLGSDENFLLGTWLARARAKGDTPAAMARVERNARDLVTLWDGRSDSLDDYGSRSWAGLVGRHYKARWSRYIDDLRGGWSGDATPAYSGSDLELAFLDDTTAFATTPAGDTVAIAQGIHDRLAPAMRGSASLRWSVPQEETAPGTLRFDITERFEAGTPQRLTLSRQFGDASVSLQKIEILSGDVSLHSDATVSSLDGTAAVRSLPPLSPAETERVFLEVTLQGPGNHAVANGPITLATVFAATESDHVGRFEYQVGNTSYAREFRSDGSLVLFVDGEESGNWNGFTWRFVDGEAHCFRADGSLFERHYLGDRQTLFFAFESHYGPALRVPASAFYQEWADELGLASADTHPEGDLDRDGRSNLEEFLFGTDILRSDRSLTFQRSPSGLILGWLQRARPELESMSYELQSSSDLAGWDDHPDLATPAQLVGDYRQWTAAIPLTSDRRFYRLRVALR